SGVKPGHGDQIDTLAVVLVVLLQHVLGRADAHEIIGASVGLDAASCDDAAELDQRSVNRARASRVALAGVLLERIAEDGAHPWTAAEVSAAFAVGFSCMGKTSGFGVRVARRISRLQGEV